jgi:hypothetical protein
MTIQDASYFIFSFASAAQLIYFLYFAAQYVLSLVWRSTRKAQSDEQNY